MPETVVGIYRLREQAETSLMQLRRSGFDMRQVSFVARSWQNEGHRVGAESDGEASKDRSKIEAFLKWTQLISSARLALPSIGLVFVAGPLTAWFVDAADRACHVRGLGAMGAALHYFRIPRNSALKIESAARDGKLLVVAHGAPIEIAQARSIMNSAGAAEVFVHRSQDIPSGSTDSE